MGPAALTPGSIAHLPEPTGKLVTVSQIHDPGDHNEMMLKMLVETNTDSVTVPINWRQEDTKNHKAHFYMCVVAMLAAQLHPTLLTPWTVAHQAPLSMEFSRQEQWNG